MKDSLQALENLTYCVNGMESKEKYYNIIKQDLERFEKYKNENCDYQIKNAKLQEENEKLKQALDILKRANLEYYDDYLIFNDRTAIRINFKEYKLLKEVFGND